MNAGNKKNITVIFLISMVATAQFLPADDWDWKPVTLPVMPVSILGGTLAIFLGFRNNSTYDRWWEARKIWGGIVNISRSFTTLVLTCGSDKLSEAVSFDQMSVWEKSIVYRHIAWLYTLKMYLRRVDHWEKYLNPSEGKRIRKGHNKPTQILHKQGVEIRQAYDEEIIEDFRHIELASVIKELHAGQCMVERIKSTIFPYCYNYFTKVFLWLFIFYLPFTLVSGMSRGTVAMGTAISFVFIILEKTGAVTEDPFEDRVSDTPISAITRNIAIDLLEMLDENDIPASIKVQTGTFDVQFIS